MGRAGAGRSERAPVVIVVEDDADLLDSVRVFLRAEGFDVRGVGGGRELEAAWRKRPCDILVLDVNLPDDSGFAVAARMRAVSPVGIIMMTARSTVDDRISGLECGADSFLVKPVEPRELVAAIRSLARRLAVDPSPAAVESEAWVFDTVNWALTAPNGRSVDLTFAEFNLVSTLVETPGEAVTADALMSALGTVVASSRRGLDSVLVRFRRKVEERAGVSAPIKSVRLVGYIFVSPVVKR